MAWYKWFNKVAPVEKTDSDPKDYLNELRKAKIHKDKLAEESTRQNNNYLELKNFIEKRAKLTFFELPHKSGNTVYRRFDYFAVFALASIGDISVYFYISYGTVWENLENNSPQIPEEISIVYGAEEICRFKLKKQNGIEELSNILTELKRLTASPNGVIE